jgi:hypothetical protein
MQNIRLQLAFQDLRLRVLYSLSEIDNSLGLPIKNPKKPYLYSISPRTTNPPEATYLKGSSKYLVFTLKKVGRA